MVTENRLGLAPEGSATRVGPRWLKAAADRCRVSSLRCNTAFRALARCWFASPSDMVCHSWRWRGLFSSTVLAVWSSLGMFQADARRAQGSVRIDELKLAAKTGGCLFPSSPAGSLRMSDQR